MLREMLFPNRENRPRSVQRYRRPGFVDQTHSQASQHYRHRSLLLFITSPFTFSAASDRFARQQQLLRR
jgi:hypothetical protein